MVFVVFLLGGEGVSKQNQQAALNSNNDTNGTQTRKADVKNKRPSFFKICARLEKKDLSD
ncbi:MAG: hypothetical protein Fur006_28100 [Coleofasciculaceae cyanobacterium]